MDQMERANFYRPQRSYGQGYVFTRVCDSVNKGGSASVHAGIPPPPEKLTPPESRHPPWEVDTPPGSRSPPGSRLRHTVNERPVRILLECILVVLCCLLTLESAFLFCDSPVRSRLDRLDLAGGGGGGGQNPRVCLFCLFVFTTVKHNNNVIVFAHL